jgi:hypothetical protein
VTCANSQAKFIILQLRKNKAHAGDRTVVGAANFSFSEIVSSFYERKRIINGHYYFLIFLLG